LIHHVDVGPRDADVVVLLHGLTATHRYWKQNIDALAERRRVIALDLPGFGSSHKPDVDYSIDFFVRELMRFLDEKSIARASLVGNSMGGHIAMAAALGHRQRIDKLVLVDPAGVTAFPLWLLRVASWMAVSAAGVIPVQPRVPRPFVRALFTAVFPARPDLTARYVAAYVRAIASPEYPLHLRAALRAARGVTTSPMHERLHALMHPTLIMWGAKDRLLPVRAARTLQRLIRGSRLVIYRESGHCPMVDQPARWNRDVIAFLDGEPVGRAII
jgi:pimeloyl-ACP methyl ester carboxylesterase